MKEENPFLQIYFKNFEEERLSETFDRFYKISGGLGNIENRNTKLAKVCKKLKENGVDAEKIEKIEDLLFQTDFHIFFSDIYIVAFEEGEKFLMEMDTTCRMMEYKQAIEEFLRRTESMPSFIPAQVIVEYLLNQILKRLQGAEKFATYRQEYLDFLDEQKSKVGVKPYRGKGVESMAIFRHLVGELGELLNPHFRGNPGVTTPHLAWPCAEAIAELLNGYFVNLKANFNADLVRKKFDSYIEKK